MNLYIPVFSLNVSGFCFSSGMQNPGIGGTEFTSIKLAILLAEKYPEINVSIAHNCHFLVESKATNIKVEAHASLDSFLKNIAMLGNPSSIVLMTQGLLHAANQDLLLRIHKRIIGWVHFPYVSDRLIEKLKLPAIVHVGSDQYWSNKPFYTTNWYIQNPFSMPNKAYSSLNVFNTDFLRIVHLGALYPSKGFNLIARQWSKLKAAYPGIQLHVIGSSATYGVQPENKHIPCFSEYAEELLSFINISDIETNRVIFHGNLGEEKYEIIRNCHVALLNPTGRTEAFPASVLECMACGVPVIASDNYGMADAMRFFPQLALGNPNQISEKIDWLTKDPSRYSQMRERSIYVAKWFDSQTDLILARWVQLFQYMNSSFYHGRIPDNPPLEKHHVSHRRLYWIQLRTILRSYKAYIHAYLKSLV